MQYVEVDGIRLSKIGLGCWQFGSREWGYGRNYAEHEAIRITQRALDLGINLIDTAEIYGFGQSERIVGQAIGGVATRPSWRRRSSRSCRSRRSCRTAPAAAPRASASTPSTCTRSTGPTRSCPTRSRWRGCGRCSGEGLIRHVGVSNYSLARWQQAERALGSPVISNQVEYSLAARDPDRALVPYAGANDRMVIAYSPLAQGFLTARYDADHRPGGIRTTNALFLPANLERGSELLEALRRVAQRHDATPAQVALAWVIHRRNVVAIPGASSVEQLERNAAAADLELSDEDDGLLTEASDRFHPRTGLAAAPDFMRAWSR